MKRGSWILKMVALGILMVLVIVSVTQWLWNWLVPDLFNGPAIGFWQTLGLLVLSKILFWGFGGKHHGKHGGHWKPYWKSRWNAMSEEEREKFRQKMREKCGWGRSDKPEKEPGQEA